MKTRIPALLLTMVMTGNIVLLPGCNHNPQKNTATSGTILPAETTQETTPSETTVPETTVPETTASPETTAPPTTALSETTAPAVTAPPVNDQEMIGSLYTRGELMAMENEHKGFGPGTAGNGVRPSGSTNCQNAYGAYGANFIAPDNGKIYLTFDCGYEHTIVENGQRVRLTEKILNVLKEKDVKAVFFVTLYYCETNPDLVQRMIDEGHAVGNHTNNHPVMPECSIDTMVYEVMSLHEYVEQNFGYTMTLFRPPTGGFSTRSLAVVQSLGYKNVHWSFAYADWETDNQPDPVSAMNQVVGRHHSGAIYLLHAVSATNAAILGDVIDQFRAMNYELDLFQ